MKKYFLYAVIGAVAVLFAAGCSEETPSEKVTETYSGTMKKATDSAQSLSNSITEKSNQALKAIE